MKAGSDYAGVEKERRAVQRFSKKDTIKCISINSEKCLYLLKCENISEKGIGFISPIELKENDLIEIIVFFEHSISIQLLTRVVRTNTVNGEFFIGGEFVGMLSCNYEILKSALNGFLDEN